MKKFSGYMIYVSNTFVRLRSVLPQLVSVEFIQHNKTYKERTFNSRTVIWPVLPNEISRRDNISFCFILTSKLWKYIF